MEITLLDVQTGKAIDYISVGIDESSDTGTPNAEWIDSGLAKVSRLDYHHNLTATLDARRWVQR